MAGTCSARHIGCTEVPVWGSSVKGGLLRDPNRPRLHLTYGNAVRPNTTRYPFVATDDDEDASEQNRNREPHDFQRLYLNHLDICEDEI